MFNFKDQLYLAVAGLSNIWTPYPGEIENIIKQQKNTRQMAENSRQQEENARQQEIVRQQIVARQQEIVRQQIVARQRELEQQNPYYQSQIGNSPSPRTRSPPPTYFMTTPNGTIHYYY